MNNNYAPLAIRDDALVTLTQMGEEARLVYMKHRNNGANTIKLDKGHYRAASDKSGTVHECRHTDNRGQSPKSMRKTFNNLRDIVNVNTAEPERCKWITLTYEENVTDPKILMKDWGNFLKKAHRVWGDFEYIMVKEPQERGAWHLHVIMIFDGKAPYIDNGVLCKKWGNGYVTVKNVENGSSIGRYLSKGCRLSQYPKGIRIFNCSSGIKRPVKTTVTKAEADLILRDKEEVSQYSKVIRDDNGREINQLYITTYRNREEGGD